MTADAAQPSALDRICAAVVVAVLRADTADQAVAAAHALVAGGIRAIELTFTTPGVDAGLRRLRDDLPSDAVIGAGTIRNRDQLDAAVGAGAEFVVTPHLDPALLEAMLATGLAVLPGVLTPSEVAAALDQGATAIKLFPASTVGPRHLESLLGPFPGLQAVPTGGIGPADARAWLDAGAIAVGAGSELCPAAAIRSGDAAALTAAARAYRAAAGV